MHLGLPRGSRDQERCFEVLTRVTGCFERVEYGRGSRGEDLYCKKDGSGEVVDYDSLVPVRGFVSWIHFNRRRGHFSDRFEGPQKRIGYVPQGPMSIACSHRLHTRTGGALVV